MDSSLSPALTFLEAERAMPLMALPVRTTVIELQHARILFSPASTLGPERLASAGAVTDVIAPNLLHLAGMAAAAAAHPQARIWGPPGAAERMPALAWNSLGDAWPHEEELPVLELKGMPGAQEHVFLHRASRSLLVADLVFNLEHPKGAGAWLILHLFGTYARFAASRLFTGMVKDRAAFGESVRRVGALDFDHVVPAHGSIVVSDAKPRLLAALRERGYSAG